MRLELSVGPLEHQTNGSELPTLPALLSASSHFALVNSGAEMAGFRPEAEEKKRRRLKGLFEGVEFLRDERFTYLRLFEWPGTKAMDERFMVYGPLTNEARSYFAGATKQLYQTYANGWDDLSLLEEKSIVFYNCTHEEFGSIFGNRTFLDGLPASLEARPPSYTDYRIRGEPLDRDLVLSLA